MEFLVPGALLLAVYVKNGYIPVTGNRTLKIEIAENFGRIRGYRTGADNFC